MRWFAKKMCNTKYDSSKGMSYIVGNPFFYTYDGTTYTLINRYHRPKVKLYRCPYAIGSGSYAGFAYRLEGDYMLTLAGCDSPKRLTYINNRWIAITQYSVFESVNKVDWIEHALPYPVPTAPLSKVTGYPVTYIFPESDGYYTFTPSSGAVNLTMTIYNSKAGLPYPLRCVPYALCSSHTVLSGFFMEGGRWCKDRIIDTVYTSPISVVSTKEVNNAMYCTGYNSNGPNFGTGGQFICCEEGLLYYKAGVCNEYGTVDIDDNAAFNLLDLGTLESVWYVVQYKFNYDYDSYYQDQSTYVKFEKYFVFTDTRVYELVYDSGTFSAVLLPQTLSGKPIFIREEYQCKWSSYWYWAGTIVRPEVHKLHIYCEGGSHLVLDASDKTVQPFWSNALVGIDLKQAVTFTSTSREDYYIANPTINCFYQDATGVVYLQKSYDDFLPVCTLPHVFYAQRRYRPDNASYFLPQVEVYTTGGMYIYHDTKGLAGPLRYGLDSTYNDITYVNGNYIYNGYAKKVYSSPDLVNWTFMAKAPYNVTHFNRSCWYFLGGYYVTYMNNTFYYFDTVSSSLKPGLSPTVGQPFTYTGGGYDYAISWAQVGTELWVLLGSYYAKLLIYTPGVTYKGLKSTPRYLPAISPGVYNCIEFSRLTFNINVTSSEPEIRCLIYGKGYGIRITLNVYPMTGQGITYPQYIYYGNSVSTANPAYIYLGSGSEYNAVAGSRTVELIFETMTAYETKFDMTIIDITVNGVSILGPNLDQTSITVSGDAWSVADDLPFKTYSDTDPFTIAALKSDDPTTGVSYAIPSLITHDNATYLYPHIPYGPSGTLLDVNVYEYDNVDHAFKLITDVNKLATLRLYHPIDTNRTRTSVELIQGNDRVFKQNNTAQLTIDGVYPLAKEATDMCFGTSYSAVVVGVEGRVVFNNLQNNSQLSIKLNTNHRLNAVAQFTYTSASVTYTRTVVVGESGFVAYTDDMFDNWQLTQLGSDDLLAIYAETFNSTGRVVIVGNNGSLYLSVTGAESWQKIDLGVTENITCLARSNAQSKLVIAGTGSYLAVSTDFASWTRIYTGLTFSARSAAEFLSNMYIGCNNGILIKSTDLYTWVYQTTNTPKDIERLVVTLEHDPRSNYINVFCDFLWCQLTQVLEDPTKYFNVGDTVYAYTNGSVLDLRNITHLTIGDIQGPYFMLMGQTYDTDRYYQSIYTSDISLGEYETIYDIYTQPQIKVYRDAACTVELTSTLYKAVCSSYYTPAADPDDSPIWNDSVLKFTLPRNSNPTYIDFYFSEYVDVSTIQFINLWIKTAYLESYWSGYQWVDQVVYYDIRNVTKTIDSYNTVDRTVRISGFYFPDDKRGWIRPIDIDYITDAEGGAQYSVASVVGIPYNSLYMLFTEDQGKAEEVTTSIWLKLSDASKLYDFLTIFSRSIFGTYSYEYAALPPTATGLHNGCPVISAISTPTTITRMRSAEMAATQPYLYVFKSPQGGLHTLSEDAFYAINYGLLVTCSNLHFYSDDSTFLAEVPEDYGFNGDFFDQTNPSGTLELRNKYYENSVWSEWYGSYNQPYIVYVFPVSSIRTISGAVSYTYGDIAGSGYYYLRSPSGGFAPLRTITGTLFFDAFYFATGTWQYISDTLIKVKPAVVTTDSNTVVFRAVLQTYTGTLYYAIDTLSYGYSSDALQPVYTFTNGQLEFSLDQYVGVKKSIYELPPLDSTNPLKINVHSKLVNRGARFIPNSVIRISGIEYDV